jgi:ribosome-associated protein
MKGKENFTAEEPVASKSQRRREALELKALASELIKLAPATLSRVPLEDNVRRAIMEAREIRSHVARKRQLQYVAKLLRRTDPEPLFQALEAFGAEARQLTGRQHRSEAWRDHLLTQGDSAVGELVSLRTNVETQAIRQLVRNANKEAAKDKPPASARTLFRILRDMDEQQQLPPLAPS